MMKPPAQRYLLNLCGNRSQMSQDPKKRNKDSKDVAEENIVEQSKDNEDPAAEPIEISGEREQEGAGADSLVL